MGRGDSRNSSKMRRKKAQSKLKARRARKVQVALKGAGKKPAEKAAAPKKKREKADKAAAPSS